MRDSYECKLVQGWIEQLHAFKEKGDLEDSDYDTLEEIELNLNQYESAYGGIGDNLDQFLNRARKILNQVKDDYDLYDEDAEWESMFPNHEDDDTDIYSNYIE